MFIRVLFVLSFLAVPMQAQAVELPRFNGENSGTFHPPPKLNEESEHYHNQHGGGVVVPPPGTVFLTQCGGGVQVPANSIVTDACGARSHDKCVYYPENVTNSARDVAVADCNQ